MPNLALPLEIDEGTDFDIYTKDNKLVVSVKAGEDKESRALAKHRAEVIVAALNWAECLTEVRGEGGTDG